MAVGAALGILALLLGCGDNSLPFALPDGCYYAEENGIAVLKVQGEQGLILTPSPVRRGGYTDNSANPIHRVHLRSRVNREGPYLEVSPGFYVEIPGHRAVASGQPMARFSIEVRPTGPTIMIPMEAHGETPVRLGRPC